MLDSSLAQSLLDTALDAGAQWAQLYAEHISDQHVRVTSHGTTARQDTERGFGMRVRGPHGHFDLYGNTPEALRIHLLDALGDVPGPAALAVEQAGVPSSSDLPDLEQRRDAACSARDAAIAVGLRPEDVTAETKDRVKTAFVADTQGTLRHYTHRSARIWANATARRGDTSRQAVVSPGLTGSGDLFPAVDPRQVGRDAAERSRRLLRARPAPEGDIPVVFGPGAGGVLLHEVCGHGLEGDIWALPGTAYFDRLAQQIASPLLTVVDDPTLPGAWGSYAVDDEGTLPGPVLLIKDGVLVGGMHDLDSARIMNAEATGNARRQTFAHAPIPRMSNTYVTAGSDDPADIVAGVDHGLYVITSGNGRFHPRTGDFTVEVQEARLIERGRLTHTIADAVVTGNCLDALASIEAVGNDVRLVEGSCRKNGQWAGTSSGNPTLRVRTLTAARGRHG